jgi:hypothetical protein
MCGFPAELGGPLAHDNQVCAECVDERTHCVSRLLDGDAPNGATLSRSLACGRWRELPR